ncbi:MAG: acetate--CoA ligase family protein [Candidatus Marsarchaeota archaeon]|jgi:acetyl coenzyme A synthetase (ADP forming)-like protein|nr:acetate--CoA ligase family protein [Candidatus Marsarchaeota archaeon]
MVSRKKFDLGPMLKPKSVAVIGASHDSEKVGHIILQNYINGGYSGRLYAVNKDASSKILGIDVYTSIMKIKDRIDLAVIAIPAQMVPEALEECGKAKVKTAVVVSGGFSEVGETELQNEIVRIADRYGIAMLGPNCLGVMDPRSRVDTLFLPTYKLSKAQIGGVSFVAQSGAVGSTVLDLISGEGFGLSKFFSYGNAAQVDEVDILEYLMNDDETKVIVMYIEGIKRGKEFIEIAKKITKIKPVIVLKAGKTAAGASAAHSHTASLAGSYEAHDAVFRQFGFVIANDISELIYYSKIFAYESEPSGGRVAIITNGGGTGVLTADAVSSTKHLTLAEFSGATKKILTASMPKLVNIRNPLDLAGDADSKRYGDAIAAVAGDQNTDIIAVIVLFQTPGADSEVAAELIKIKQTANKPMIVISIGSEYTQMHKIMMESGGVPVFDSPLSAATALEGLLDYGNYKKAVA